MPLKKNTKLVLEDGSVFYGHSFGSDTSGAGEVVFSTGMVGYPESLTDPSYKGQILCLTFPLIGNYGVPGNNKDKFGLDINFESDKIQVQGLAISDYSFHYSHWSAKKSLAEWLKEHNVPGIYSIDTRELTKKLREKGSMLGKVITGEEADFYDPNRFDLVRQVAVKEPVIYEPNNLNSKKNKQIKNSINMNTLQIGNKSITGNKASKINIEKLNGSSINQRHNKKIILIDCGVKNNIIRNLLKRDLTVIRVPYGYDFFKFDFDGVVVSNGPGDPKFCRKAIKNIKKAISREIPIFGICLGSQLLALAAGADTYKLKYGHRSQNQPCLMNGTKRCFITTQNHGFAVDDRSLPKDWEPWFTNLNDGTNEGIRHKTKPFMSCQFHPEAAPGPVDTEFLFDDFVEMLK